jgi:hypothetical protein
MPKGVLPVQDKRRTAAKAEQKEEAFTVMDKGYQSISESSRPSIDSVISDSEAVNSLSIMTGKISDSGLEYKHRFIRRRIRWNVSRIWQKSSERLLT